MFAPKVPCERLELWRSLGKRGPTHVSGANHTKQSLVKRAVAATRSNDHVSSRYISSALHYWDCWEVLCRDDYSDCRVIASSRTAWTVWNWRRLRQPQTTHCSLTQQTIQTRAGCHRCLRSRLSITRHSPPLLKSLSDHTRARRHRLNWQQWVTTTLQLISTTATCLHTANELPVAPVQ